MQRLLPPRTRLLPSETLRLLHHHQAPPSTTTTTTTTTRGRHTRSFQTSAPLDLPPAQPPKSRDRGPKSKEETQTDFAALDMLSHTAAPATAIDACMRDGFALNSGLKVTGGAGVLLCGGEAFRWRPWVREREGEGEGSGAGGLENAKGQWEVGREAWGVLELAWPKPDLLIVGTGRRVVPLSARTRREIGELGIRVEVQDTRNAAAQFNLLATERGVQEVAAALVPVGWVEGR